MSASAHRIARLVAQVAPMVAGSAAIVTAQPIQRANPAVDSVFAEYDKRNSPGCALGVYRAGRIIYSRGYGMADLERNVPITPHSVFDIGSTSKQFTAASIVLLAQQGKLSLHDDIRKHIPELPAYQAPITINHLLHHTSGLRDYIGLMTLGGADIDDVTTEEEALAAIARQKELNFAPGTEHLYSNSGYFLLSIIVERASGKSLRDFAREQIFEPLGMTRTHYLESHNDIVPDRALAYSPRRQGGYRADVSRWLQLGDGAVFTTVEELLLWDQNFYEPKVGGAALLTELQTTGTLTNGEALWYARGLVIGKYRGQRTVAHGGAWGGYRADLIRFPERHFSVATLCNLGTSDPSSLSRRVADVFLADVLEPLPVRRQPVGATSSTPTVSVPESALRAFAGSYRNVVSRTVWTFVLENGKLFLADGGRQYELAPRSATEFALPGPPVDVTIAFDAPNGGAVQRMRWTYEGDETEEFSKIELVRPSASELGAYAGSYFSEELQATYTLAVEGDTLMLGRSSAGPQPLRPLVRDEFSSGSFTLRFTRGSDGAITGYLLDRGRVRNLRFDKLKRQGAP